MLRYAITDATYTPGHATRLAAARVDFLQLRAKHLPAGELATLARAVLAEIASVPGAPTHLLLNGRPDIALALTASTHTPVGVHLTSRPGELTPTQVRSLFAAAPGAPLPAPCISVSCHTQQEVAHAHQEAADLILFGPVFEKRIANHLIRDGSGLALLRRAVRTAHPTPVLALGGITHSNTPSCLDAGAAGIAAIRLFA